MRKMAKEFAEKGRSGKPVHLTPKKVQHYLGVPKYHFGLAEQENQIGL